MVEDHQVTLHTSPSLCRPHVSVEQVLMHVTLSLIFPIFIMIIFTMLGKIRLEFQPFNLTLNVENELERLCCVETAIIMSALIVSRLTVGPLELQRTQLNKQLFINTNWQVSQLDQG